MENKSTEVVVYEATQIWSSVEYGNGPHKAGQFFVQLCDYDAVVAERDELREKLAVVESQKPAVEVPVCVIEAIDWLKASVECANFPWDDDALEAAKRALDASLKYLAADKPADDNGTGKVLWSDSHSEDEILEEHSDNVLFDVVANLWEDIRCLREDKPAVAVPDDVKDALYRLDKTHYKQWDKESPTCGGYICGDVNTMHLVKIVEFVRELASSPSHSQRSADVTVAGSDKKSITAEQYRTLVILARRAMHIAYVWNDHNFQPAHILARETAKILDIHDLDEANDFLAGLPIRHIEERPLPAHDSEQGGEV